MYFDGHFKSNSTFKSKYNIDFEGIIKVFIILRLGCLFILHTKRNILIPQAHYVILFKVVSTSEVNKLIINGQ